MGANTADYEPELLSRSEISRGCDPRHMFACTPSLHLDTIPKTSVRSTLGVPVGVSE